MSRELRDVVFTLLILLLVAAAVWQAGPWALKARLFPWVIGFSLLALLVGQLALSMQRLARVRQLAGTAEAAQDSDEQDDIDPVVAKRRALAMTGWLVGFAAMIWALSFPIGGTLATLVYLRLAAREKWVMCLAVTAGTAVFFWLMAGPLNVPFPNGFLLQLLQPVA